MDSNLLDLFLVVSLSVIAVSSLIFIIYFVPVLIQLAKTLEAVQSLLNTFRNYFGGISSEFDKFVHLVEGLAMGFGSGLGKTSTLAFDVFNFVKDFVEDFLSAKKR